MGTTTTTFALNKPTVGGDDNAWGTDWNTNADKLDDLLDGTTAIKPNLSEGLWKVGGVAVTATAAELNYVDGVTSAIQTQLDGKQATITGAATTITGSNLTVSRALASDASGKVVVATTTAAELNFLSGVTSSVQTQINGRVSASVDTNTTAGYTSTADADGTFTTGTYTPTPSGGNIKTISNGGAFTIAAPSAAGVYTLIVEVSNVSGAGAITMSSFARVVGDPFTTTVGHRFQIVMTKTANGVVGNVVAMQ